MGRRMAASLHQQPLLQLHAMHTTNNVKAHHLTHGYLNAYSLCLQTRRRSMTTLYSDKLIYITLPHHNKSDCKGIKFSFVFRYCTVVTNRNPGCSQVSVCCRTTASLQAQRYNKHQICLTAPLTSYCEGCNNKGNNHKLIATQNKLYKICQAPRQGNRC